ncbi:hypothetical protein Leryth_002257 [Lithospermum erythrorhizon]|nr:hypothetical protein Leryth_002257 [Lithospermum erythrorhizon]
MALTRQPCDIKTKVIISLNKLSDRDTFCIASSQLESIAKTLSNDNFAPFLSCLAATDSSEKSPVRRQCVRLVTVLSAAHGDACSPHLAKMVASVVRRLRDHDSGVRNATVEAVAAMARNITKAPFNAILKPLVDCMFHEQDYNSQVGASLCLAAAVEAAPEVDTVELKKLLPKLSKLVKNDGFKAKAALLSLVGSIVSVGGGSSRNALTNLVPCVVGYLSSEDWGVRKSAAETMVKIAVVESSFVVELRGLCLSSLENRKFDKVKIVRETMNRALEAWREIPDVHEKESLLRSQSKSLSKETSGESSTRISPRTSCDSSYTAAQRKKKAGLSRSSSISSNSSVTSSHRRSVSKNDNVKSNVARSLKVEFKNNKIEADESLATSLDFGPEDDRTPNNFNVHLAESENCFNSLPSRGSSGKSHLFNNLRYTSRVVPFCEDDHPQASVVSADQIAVEDIPESQKEFEGISLIHEQLAQIENQQSNLLELLQSFIGSSQSGMNSLEKRVNGLEKALDEMSHDLGISTRRISDNDTAGNTCCLLPGAEFLSPKFWRKTEGQSSNGRFSFSSRNQPIYNKPNKSNKDETSETSKLESPKCQQFSCKSKNKEDDANLELHMPRRTFNKLPIDKNLHACSAGAALVRNVRQETYATGRV